jgi:2-polyprenyl-3-methyl-5-hydroxy-6-metoxy-1,4-benzoquinol methylase
MSLLTFIKSRLIKGSPERLDLKYKTGFWDSLRRVEELAHYSIVAGYFQFLKRDGSLLDIGCGEGLLRERIGSGNYSFYTGFDLSAQAILMTKSKEDIKTSFLVADMNTYTPTNRFDAIIFNEVIYYSNVLNTLQRYSEFLKKDGVFILSNFDSQNDKINWSDITPIFQLYDETIVINKNGTRWVIKVLLNNSGRKNRTL